MKKLMYLIVLTLILGLVLTGCLLSNVGQVPTTEQSGITYLTKSGSPPNLVNLVGLWHFDEGSGTTAYDSSGNSNHGAIYGATFVDGKFGKALSFDGIDDYVDCGNEASLRPSNGITVEAWVNYEQFFSDSGGHAAICEGYYYDGTGFMLYQACGYPYNTVRYYVNTTDVGNPIGQSSKLLSTNTWYHLAMVYDGSCVTLYIDGAYDSSVATTGSISWAGTIRNLYIGSTYTAGGAKFKGIIDEVHIWNTALAEDQLGSVIVAMDIKPQSCPNPLNVKNQGVLPVAVLGTDNFDVNDIDPSTILLEGVPLLRWSIEDVATPFERSADCFNCSVEGPDGIPDLTLKFDTMKILNMLDLSTEALVDESEITLNGRYCLVLKLMGNLYNGTPIFGEDTVLIIKKGKF